EKTYGKGNFQTGFELSDGSLLNISIGKYYTPNGVSLTGVGITPDIECDLSDEDYANLYYGLLEREDDVQLQIALDAIKQKIS
ncbi:MAG: S41 family peptidase, partial [Clostridiales bacterium]|nr:S41 family peptidase [Clostridiales bacterium]